MTSSDNRDDTNDSQSSKLKQPRRRPSFHIETSSDEEEEELEFSAYVDLLSLLFD